MVLDHHFVARFIASAGPLGVFWITAREVRYGLGTRVPMSPPPAGVIDRCRGGFAVSVGGRRLRTAERRAHPFLLALALGRRNIGSPPARFRPASTEGPPPWSRVSLLARPGAYPLRKAGSTRAAKSFPPQLFRPDFAVRSSVPRLRLPSQEVERAGLCSAAVLRSP